MNFEGDPEKKELEYVAINPVILDRKGSQEGNEGCLSFPELLVLVPRYKAVRIEYTNAEGKPSVRELQGFAARVVQHEYDHIEGVLTIDRAASSLDIIKASELDDFLESQEDDEDE